MSNATGSRNRLPWTIAAIAVVALAANVFWGQKERGAAADEELARLNERLDALEGPQGPVRGQRQAPLPSGAAHAAPGGTGDTSELLGEPQTPEEIAAARDRQLRELEARFAADVSDPATGPATESILVDTISGEAMVGTGLRPSNVDIACKQASCRIVGSFDRMGDAQDWSLFYITAAGGNVLSETRMVFVPKPDGKTEVRIYSNRAKG